MTTSHTCKVVVIGDGGIGKTCMLHSYTHDLEYLAERQTYVHTIFENYQAEIPVQDGSGKSDAIIRLALWDTAGQEEYDQLRHMCYSSRAMNTPPGPPASQSGTSFSSKGAAGSATSGALSSFDVGVFVVCFAWNNPQSFTNVELKWYRELKKLASELSGSSRGNSGGRPFSVILVATKSDLRREADEKQGAFVKGFISRSQASDLQRSIKADAFVECSAKTGEGVREVFQAAMLVWYQQNGLGPVPEDAGRRCTML